MKLNRREALHATMALGIGGCTHLSPLQNSDNLKFSADWNSLSNYKYPKWFSEAKFGIWAHWGPQCVPEYGDWYGRQMYIEGNPFYKHHLENYGHPSETGFIDIITKFKAENWQPEKLIEKFVKAGARYFVAMANHHDNFDMYQSKYHAWNSINIGPKIDIVGTWEKLARKSGLRFGVSNHAAHAWHWWQTAYGYDTEGPFKNVRYDAFRLQRKDGLGKAWAGLDPQELYCGPIASMVAPDGIETAQAMGKFHDETSGQWSELAPKESPNFSKNWLLRQNNLIDKYRPDYVYFDNYGLPLEEYGLKATAHFYNRSIEWNGENQAVVTGKKLNEMQMKAIVDDVEKGFVNSTRAKPWQTCTCLGNWHYDRALYTNKGYKSALDVIQRLIDVVSKNGNLLLSVPMRGDGTIDSEEERILGEIAQWMSINQEAIFDTMPFRIFGEGPTKMTEGMQNENQGQKFTPADIRFTQKDNAIYLMPLAWPDNDYIEIETEIAFKSAILLGANNQIETISKGSKTIFKLPQKRPSFTPVIKLIQ